MKQTDNLIREQTTAADLWILLHDAEQIVVNHAYFHTPASSPQQIDQLFALVTLTRDNNLTSSTEWED